METEEERLARVRIVMDSTQGGPVLPEARKGVRREDDERWFYVQTKLHELGKRSDQIEQLLVKEPVKHRTKTFFQRLLDWLGIP